MHVLGPQCRQTKSESLGWSPTGDPSLTVSAKLREGVWTFPPSVGEHY